MIPSVIRLIRDTGIYMRRRLIRTKKAWVCGYGPNSPDAINVSLLIMRCCYRAEACDDRLYLIQRQWAHEFREYSLSNRRCILCSSRGIWNDIRPDKCSHTELSSSAYSQHLLKSPRDPHVAPHINRDDYYPWQVVCSRDIRQLLSIQD